MPAGYWLGLVGVKPYKALLFFTNVSLLTRGQLNATHAPWKQPITNNQ